ncbi:hypothetical protein HK405_011488 [Cladochytrium tenue]|nr:hypothetical protein HK405_011488 [Cladochytrium tenue]
MSSYAHSNNAGLTAPKAPMRTTSVASNPSSIASLPSAAQFSVRPLTAFSGASQPSSTLTGAPIQVTCLVLGRPPSSAFIINCGADPAVPLMLVVRRIAAVLGMGEGVRLFPLISDAAPMLLFHVIHHTAIGSPPPLALSDPLLDDSNPHLTKSLEKARAATFSSGGSTTVLASAIVSYLGGKAYWVNDAMLQTSIGDFFASSSASATSEDKLDFVVYLSPPAAIGSYPVVQELDAGPAFVGPPSYHDIGAKGPRMFPQQPFHGYQPEQPNALGASAAYGVAPIVGAGQAAGAAQPMYNGSVPNEQIAFLQTGAGKSDSVVEATRRRRLFLWIGIGVAVAVVVVVAIVVGVVVSKKNSSSNTDTTSSSSCVAVTIDTFSTRNYNSLGVYMDAVNMLASRWDPANVQLHFTPPLNSSYVYEDVRNVTSAASCDKALSANYFVFYLSGNGNATLDIQTGCIKTRHLSNAFEVTTAGKLYVANLTSLVGSASTDLSAFQWEEIFSDATTSWTLGDVITVNNLTACNITGYTMIS